MYIALEEAIGEELKRACEVHRIASRVRLDPLPLAFWSANLQRSDAATGWRKSKVKLPKLVWALDGNTGSFLVLVFGSAVILHVTQVAVAFLLVTVYTEKVIIR